MNNLKDIHNSCMCIPNRNFVVLSGFQWTIWRIYTTLNANSFALTKLFYQDFNEQFEGYTQHILINGYPSICCFIRISMNNLKDIHNAYCPHPSPTNVVLSGFQWTIWRIYTTMILERSRSRLLFYQDFNEQFEGYTQPCTQFETQKTSCFIRISMNNLKDIHNSVMSFFIFVLVVLSGFQWTSWRIYTTTSSSKLNDTVLFYQDFNEQFEGYTQPIVISSTCYCSCFIRISMNNLKDIHNI